MTGIYLKSLETIHPCKNKLSESSVRLAKLWCQSQAPNWARWTCFLCLSHNPLEGEHMSRSAICRKIFLWRKYPEFAEELNEVKVFTEMAEVLKFQEVLPSKTT